MESPTHTLTARRPTTVDSPLVMKHDTDDTHSPLLHAINSRRLFPHTPVYPEM